MRNIGVIGSTNADPEKEAFVNGANAANAANDAQETDAAAWTPSEEGIANGLPKTKTVMQVNRNRRTQLAYFTKLSNVTYEQL